MDGLKKVRFRDVPRRNEEKLITEKKEPDMKRILLISELSAALLVVVDYVSAEQSKLKMYGFFDMEAEVSDKNTAGKIWTFDQHHLTVISYYDLNSNFQLVFEFSWEHGPAHPPNSAAGKIYLPKAYIQYKVSDALKFRLGKFLPTFGIYNQRHDATPTIIPTVLPGSAYGKHINLAGDLQDSRIHWGKRRELTPGSQPAFGS